MYAYKTSINSYQENKTFLSRLYGAKNDFLKQYAKLYSESEKSKELYIQVLCELKVAIFEGNLKNFKNLSNIFSYIVDYDKFKELATYSRAENYPFKETNIIILACEYNKLEILKHIFLNYSTIYEHLFKNEEKVLLPNDKDENLHNAFYYSIRADNAELVETLIKKWPDNYFETHTDELDVILSEAYEQLKLNNVLLSDATEVFVENKLINLRFFSNKTRNIQNKLSLPNIGERIELLIEQINSLRLVSKVNEEFLLTLKYIIQNINTLKRLIKITYNKIPWEEMELCLVCFVLSFTQQNEINLFYRAVLRKKRILNHLVHFSSGLEHIKNEIGQYKINSLSSLPKISRKLNSSQIIKRNPEYKELYDDYQKICDINTLNTISTYITFASSADVKKKEGQLTISRSLQVIGECLKNTLESPKLSSNMSDLLLLSLPKNTREVIIDLRNSLSHAHSLSKRIEIQQNTKVSFFVGVQNDIKKIGRVINDILFENKLKTVKDILENIVNCNDLKEVEEIISIFHMEALEKLMPENLHLSECEKFSEIIEKLKKAIPSKTAEEAEIFKKMDEVINAQSNKLEDKMEKYTIGISELSHLKKTLNRPINEQIYRSIKYVCNNALTNIKEKTVKPRTLKCLAEYAAVLLSMNQTKMECNKLEEVNTKFNTLESVKTKSKYSKADEMKHKLESVEMLVFEIICLAEIQMDNVQWVNDLREQLNEKKNIDHYQIRSYDMKDEYKEQLAFKILDLKSIIKNYKFNDLSSIPLAKNNGKIIAALEMLILDILSILGQIGNRLEDDFFFLDQNIPHLIGKNLRNHLAHYNTVTDVLPCDPVTLLILNAKIIAEKLEENPANICKYMEEDLAILKNKISVELKVITLKQKMFDALEAGNFEIFKSCIAQGADIHSRKRDNWTTLHAAAKGGNVTIVKLLIDQKVNIHIKSVNRQNPLHVAAANGNLNVVEYFIKQKYYNLEATDDTWKTPLHLAALNNQKTTIEILLKYKSNCSAKDKSGCSPLHHAVNHNHLDAVQVLLKNEKSVDDNEMNGGFTPLHLAADVGSLDVVRFLVSRGANANATSDTKVIPLHLAALNGHTEVVKILVGKNSEINAISWNGCTPLLFATENGHVEISDILLKHGANPNIFDKSYNYGPIHHTAKDGHVAILKALLKHNADPNVTTNHGKSPLDYAVGFGRLEIVKILHKQGVSLQGRKVCSSLHLAVKYGHIDIVEYLIDQKVDINAVDITGMTPLLHAASEGHIDIVSLLIKKNANVNSRNSDSGFTPLLAVLGRCIQGIDKLPYQTQGVLEQIYLFQIADDKEKYSSLQHKYEKIVEILLNNGADADAKLVNGTAALHFAAAGGNCSIVNMLLERNAAVNQQCKQGFTPLHSAVMFGHKPVVELLLANKAKIHFKGSLNYSALHFAVEYGHKNIVKLLLANNANINEKNREDWSPVAITLKEDRGEILELLIQNGADVHENKEKYLMLSILKGSKDVFKLLVKHTMVKNDPFLSGELLHFAIARNNVDAINTLIAHGVNVKRGKSDNSPLLHAVAENHVKIVEILLKNGADVNAIIEPEGLSALHIAAMVDNVEIIEILLKHGADINARNKDNYTILHYAVASGFYHMVKFLFPLINVNINEKGVDDFTLLHIAAQSGSVEIIKFLIERGADLHMRATKDAKPIHIAVREGQLEVLKYFVDQGMDIRTELDAFERTLLHYAALTNRVEIAQYLIEKGADVNARDADGITPLYVAVVTATAEFITVLLKNGAMYNLGNKLGQKPIEICKDGNMRRILFLADKLFQSVKQNNLSQVASFIKSGALVNVRNAEDVTPLHFAAWKGYNEVVSTLLEHNANPNAIGKKGFTPLHYAAKFGQFKVCMTLLSNGAIYNAAGENGKIPLDLSEKKDVTDLLKVIHSCFEKVTSKNTKVLAELKKLKDASMIKTVMSACNREGKTLIASAILHDFPKVDEMKEVLQNDLADIIKAADSLCFLEDFDNALKIYRKALEIRTEILGKNNLGTLDIKSDIAKVLYKQYKYEESLKIYTEVYEQQKCLLGENSKEALNTRSTLALVLHRLGRHNEAISVYEAVYEEQKKILTLDDQDLRSTLLHTAVVLIALGRNEEALELNTKVFEHRKKKLGLNHQETLVMQNNIAMVLNNLGRHEESLKMFRKVHEGRKKVLGLHHSDTLRTFHNIIMVLEAQKKHNEAMQAFKELLKTQEEQLGPDHLDTLNTQQSMATLCVQQGKAVSALKIYNKYLPAMRQKLGPNHPNVRSGETIVQTIKNSFQRSGYSEIVDVIDNLNNEARTAASNGDLQTLKFLIKNDLGVNDPDAEGRTLLHYACDTSRADVVLLLLDSGAHATRSSNKGNTPLHLAALKGREDIAKLLLGRVERAAVLDYVNAKTSSGGNTALHVAARAGHHGVVRLLLVHGASCDLKNKEGNTPVQLSHDYKVIELLESVESMFEYARTGNVEVLHKMQSAERELLIVLANARNRQDKTLVQVAISHKHQEIAKEMLAAMKKLSK